MHLLCPLPPSLPPATIAWKKNERLLTESDFISGRVGITLAGELVIHAYEDVSDPGRYQCQATNQVLGISVITADYLLIGEGVIYMRV